MSEYRLQARISEHAQLDITTDNLTEMGNALVFFGLGTPQQAAPAAVVEEPTPVVAEEPAAPKQRKPRAPKAEAAATTIEEPAAAISETAAAPATAAADEGNEPAAEPTPAPEAETPASTASSVVSATPAEAAEAVRAYGAKKGIVAARELLQSFGFAKTADITADKAGAVVAAAQV